MPNIHAIKDHFKESKLYVNRVVIAIILVFLLVVALVARLIFLQIYQYDLYKTLSLHNQVRIVPVTPNRGLIFDRQGVLLAENIPVFTLEIIPEQVTDLQATLETISRISPLSENEKKQFLKQVKYKSSSEAIPLRLKLTEKEVAQFSVEKHRLPGVEIAARLTRHYPFGELFAHVLGYVGPISEQEQPNLDKSNYRGTYQIGKTGIERYYEPQLHGQVGYQHVETDAKGRMIRVLKKIPPSPGNDLHLSIDIRLQQIAYQALSQFKGAMVAIEPDSGNVLAMISNPSFDPNLFSQGMDTNTYDQLANSTDRPLFNRAIQAQYPPGSIIKPLVALKALETPAIDTNELIDDPGYYQINNEGRLYRDLIYTHGKRSHGMINLDKALTLSCDAYFFRLAHELGIEQLYEVYTRFGLGKVTGIDTYGESTGLVPSIKWKEKNHNAQWYTGDTLNIGVGQGWLLTTPLQMAQAVSMIANQGQTLTPKLVTNPSSTEQFNSSRSPLSTKKNLDRIIRAMKDVVHTRGGTAHKISHNLSYTIAGKTGTAQVYSLKPDEIYDPQKIKPHLRDHSWFIAFAPVDNPKIALAVLIENKLKKSGSQVAREILDGFFETLNTDKENSNVPS